MIGLEAGGERLKKPLAGTHDRRRATNVLQEQQLATGAQPAKRVRRRSGCPRSTVTDLVACVWLSLPPWPSASRRRECAAAGR